MSPIPQTHQPILRSANLAPQTQSRVETVVDDNDVVEKFSGLVKALNSRQEKMPDQPESEKDNSSAKAVAQQGADLTEQGNAVKLVTVAIEQQPQPDKVDIAAMADAAIPAATPVLRESTAKNQSQDPQPENRTFPNDSGLQQAVVSSKPASNNTVGQNTTVADKNASQVSGKVSGDAPVAKTVAENDVANNLTVVDPVATAAAASSVAVSNLAVAIIAGGSADKPVPRQRPAKPANADVLIAKQDKPVSQSDAETQLPLKTLAESGQELAKRTAGTSKDLPQQLMPKSQVEVVAVADNRVEKHFPADTVQQAWQQIGKKLVQELASTTSNQNKAAPLATGNSGEMFTSSAKTVKHLTIQLKPENLGTVVVKLTMVNGGLEVTLSATDRHLAGRLLRNANSLSSQLKSAGFSFENLSVQFADLDSSQPVRTAGNLANGDGNQTLNGQNNQRQSQAPETAFGNSKEQKSGQNSDEQSNYEKNETLHQPMDIDDHPDGSIFI